MAQGADAGRGRPAIVLFDLDGTLVSTAGAGRRAIELALAERGARDCCRFSFAGMTDRAIVRRALLAAGLAADEGAIDAVLDAYVEALRVEVARAGPDYRVHPGVIDALDALAVRPGCQAVGLGTGNIREGARIKLGRVGLFARFAFGGFGSDAEDRAEILRIGAERGAAQLGRPRERCRVVVVGDTPRDVAAARAIGARALCVATGPCDRAELAASGPDHLFATLGEPGAIAALVREASAPTGGGI
ncbi:MAG: haloacid dehalogenase-like hydrolase [Deltaproteobacteria bacterium]|nr:haloacid dehalogenase-like hydrolase [Deltaproteobacteria bacterium]